MRAAPPAPGWRTWLALPVALLALNASLTFVNVWPTPKVRWGGTLSVELAAAVLLLAIAERRRVRLARTLLPALWVPLVAGHYLDVTAPGLYGRDVNLYWDAQHLGNVTGMLSYVAPWWLIALVLAAVVSVIAGAFLLGRLAFGPLVRACEVPTLRRALGATACVLVAFFLAGEVSGASAGTGVATSRGMVRPWFADPASAAYVRQARFVLAMVGPWRVAPTLGATPPAMQRDLRPFGADVVLAFVESYGAVTYDRPDLARVVAPARHALAAAASASGRQVLSAFVDSPTFGASSWLAHLSLLSGVEVRDQYAYTVLMTEPRDTLPRLFRRSGYRAVALMPGVRQAWPEGAFYGFDRIYGRADLEYRGPQFGWWGIPDQYALAAIDAREFTPDRTQPVFVVFPTSTTHAPFGPVAPYLADWSQVRQPDAYDPDEIARIMAAPPDLTNLSPSYAHATAYDLQCFAGYVQQHAADDQVLILIGDHQPPAAVSGPGASHEVPMHVVTSRPEVVRALRAAGFVPGVVPQRPAVSRMHALVPTLVEAFAASPRPVAE